MSNNKTEVPQKGTKKRGLFAALLAVLGAGAATSTGLAIYYGLQPKENTVDVTFYLDGGVITGGTKQKVIRGSKIGQLPVPYKEAKYNQIFDRWEDVSGNVHKPEDIINNKMDVYAKYKEAGSLAHTVTMDFAGGSIEGLEGNQVKVIDNTVIASLPSPVLDGYIFWYWTDDEGNELLPSTPITGDMTVHAQYKDISTSTNLLGGQTLITLKAGETWTTPAWELWKGSKQVEGPTWSLSAVVEGEEVPAGVTIDATTGVVHCDGSTPPGNYTIVINAQKGETYGTAKFAVVVQDYQYTIDTNNQTTILTKDNITTTSKAFSFLVDGEAPTTGSVSWSVQSDKDPVDGKIEMDASTGVITATTVSAGVYTLTVKGVYTDAAGKTHEASVKVGLVSESTKAETIVIDAPTYLRSTESYVCEAYAYPTTSSIDVSWDIDLWEGEGEEPEINKTTGEITTSYDTWGYLVIRADDSKSGNSGYAEIEIAPPYVESNVPWIYDIGNNEYVELNVDDLCDSNATYIRGSSLAQLKIQKYDRSYERAHFGNGDAPVEFYIGQNMAAIPDNFGINMEEFNSPINFVENTNFNVEPNTALIGKNFMKNCRNWNNGGLKYLVGKPFTLPDSVKVIDDCFLDGCYSFDNGNDVGPAQPFVLPAEISTLGTDFMNDCWSFNTDLTIPSTVTHVGDNFMVNCYSMAHTLAINCDPIVFDAPGDESYTLSVNEFEDVPAYEQHVKIAGAYRDEFMTRFPNRLDGEVTYAYRNLEAYSADFYTCEWDTIRSCAKRLEENRGDTEAINHFLSLFYFEGEGAPTKLDDFVGKEKVINIYGVDHTTKIIGLDHDELVNQPEGESDVKALFTFEFSTLLTMADRSDMYCVSTSWFYSWDPVTVSVNNHNCLEKGLNAYIQELAPYLPIRLRNSVVPVKKAVSTTNDTWASRKTLSPYSANFFGFTATELGLTGSETEGSAYTNPTLDKKDARGTPYAYWLVSPDTSGNNNAFAVGAGWISSTTIDIYRALSLGFAI